MPDLIMAIKYSQTVIVVTTAGNLLPYIIRGTSQPPGEKHNSSNISTAKDYCKKKKYCKRFYSYLLI
jgi:hypothetical protein